MGRRKTSAPWFFIATLAAAAIVLIWIFIPKQTSSYPRQTLVIVGSPMTVVSWNQPDRTLTLITIPEDMEADGTHGYGTYSFEAFWKLGEIDKKDGTVLAESMSEALGVPVTWYIGPKSGLFQSASDSSAMAKDIFSVGHIVSYLSGTYRTNIPFSTFVNFVWLLQVTKPDRVQTFDFTQTPTMIADDVTIADGSHQLVLNPAMVDSRLAHVFEDDGVRTETVTAQVFNTTAIPSLGNRVARLLGNLGVSVVSVGNDTPEVEACTVSGTEDSLRSQSANVIESVLGCTPNLISSSDRADLTIRIGKTYAKRFLPN